MQYEFIQLKNSQPRNTMEIKKVISNVKIYLLMTFVEASIEKIHQSYQH